MNIVFYRGSDIIDRTILFFSRGGYSHCGILLNDGTVIDAKPFSNVKRRPDIYDGAKLGTEIHIYNIPSTSQQDRIIEDFLNKQIGKSYDYMLVLGFLLYTSELNRKKRNKWICSELVFAALRKANIKLLDRIEAWKISPTILSYSPILKFWEDKTR